jgi:hypothetical protein
MLAGLSMNINSDLQKYALFLGKNIDLANETFSAECYRNRYFFGNENAVHSKLLEWTALGNHREY